MTSRTNLLRRTARQAGEIIGSTKWRVPVLSRLLPFAWSSDEPRPNPAAPRISYHLALGDAHRLAEPETAAAHYHAALAIEPNLAPAHIGLATLRMPGDDYFAWLSRLYAALEPESIIEIGVGTGPSLACAGPATLAIGVDPNPRAVIPPNANVRLFAETSDAFFAQRRPDALLAGRPLGVGFIDGLHLYEQALRDFINLERYCGPRSVILLHDTMPLDERTQRRTRETDFHTGDVWKTVLCLKHYRPDLDIFTIATPWTGLTVVTGLDSTSRALTDRYDEAVAAFIEVPFGEIHDRVETALNVVPNAWTAVEARLKARGIL